MPEFPVKTYNSTYNVLNTRQKLLEISGGRDKIERENTHQKKVEQLEKVESEITALNALTTQLAGAAQTTTTKLTSNQTFWKT